MVPLHQSPVLWRQGLGAVASCLSIGLLSIGVRAASADVDEAQQPESPPASAAETVSILLEIDEVQHLAILRPLVLRSPSCVLEIVGQDGQRQETAPGPSRIWRGTAEGLPHGTILGLLEPGDGEFAILDPHGLRWLKGRSQISDPAPQVPAWRPVRCATSDAEVSHAPPTTPEPDADAGSKETAPATRNPAEVPCRRLLHLAVELDSAAIELFGGRRDLAIAQVELLLAAAFEVLSSQVGVEARIDRLVCLESESGSAPLPAGDLYAETWARWAGRPDQERPTCILSLTGRPLAEESFGLAWIGGVAGGPAQRCVVASLAAAATQSGRCAVLLHLVAHLLGADHCPPDCGLLEREWPKEPAGHLDQRSAVQIAALLDGLEALPRAPLAAPSQVHASDGRHCAGVELRWEPVDSAESYAIERAPDADEAPMQRVATVAGPPWIDAGAPPGTRFRYRVVAVDRCGESEPSAAAIGFAPVAVETPQDLLASDGIVCGEVHLSWQVQEHAAGYEILRHVVNNPAMAAVVGSSGEGSFVDSAPPPGLAWYWVRAVDRCGRRGPLSRGDSGRPGDVPPAPGNVVATDGTACSSIIVSWNAVAEAGAYDIWRAATPDFASAVHLSQVPRNAFEDRATAPGISLFYWIRAIGPCGRGPFAGPARGQAAGSVPRLTLVGDDQAVPGEPYRRAAPGIANAECAEPVQWYLAAGPEGMTIAADGSIEWSNPAIGVHDVAIGARNDSGSGQRHWTLRVLPQAPQLSSVPDQTTACGAAWTPPALSVANAGRTGRLRWSLASAPSGATIDQEGRLLWTSPTLGRHQFTVRVAGEAGESSTSLQLDVVPARPSPLAMDDVACSEGQTWEARLGLLNAACAGTATWSLREGPAGLTVDSGGAVRWETAAAGRHRVRVAVANEAGEAEVSWTIDVRPEPPVEDPDRPT